MHNPRISAYPPNPTTVQALITIAENYAIEMTNFVDGIDGTLSMDNQMLERYNRRYMTHFRTCLSAIVGAPGLTTEDWRTLRAILQGKR